MAVMWTERLAVGVEKIDNQHKELFRRADQLFEAGRQGKSKEIIGELLDFLEQYTRTHFTDEERYLQSIGYPELEAQKRAHGGFVRSLQDLKKEFEKSGGNLVVIINANKLVVDWLTNHISIMDKKFGEFAKNLNK
jgi:hemerythrin